MYSNEIVDFLPHYGIFAVMRGGGGVSKQKNRKELIRLMIDFSSESI